MSDVKKQKNLIIYSDLKNPNIDLAFAESFLQFLNEILAISYLKILDTKYTDDVLCEVGSYDPTMETIDQYGMWFHIMGETTHDMWGDYPTIKNLILDAIERLEDLPLEIEAWEQAEWEYINSGEGYPGDCPSERDIDDIMGYTLGMYIPQILSNYSKEK